MIRTLFIFFGLISLPTAGLADETLSGTADILSATSMVVDGKTVSLFGIKSPKTGTMCTWKSKRQLDCAKLATAGLKDISIAANVVCSPQSNKTYVCKADGFDLAYGLIHAGWAVPTTGAPKRYFTKRDEARDNKRGLWGAVDQAGKTIASQL